MSGDRPAECLKRLEGRVVGPVARGSGMPPTAATSIAGE